MGYNPRMKFDQMSRYFGRSVEIVTRPIPPAHEEGHYEGVLEQIDGDLEHVYLRLLDPAGMRPPYRRHGRGAHANSVPINEIREVRVR